MSTAVLWVYYLLDLNLVRSIRRALFGGVELSDPDQYFGLELMSYTFDSSINAYHVPAVCFHNCATSRNFFIVNF